jgi:hypothetical protein
MTVRPSHWKRVSGILGLWVGKKGSEIQVADADGNLMNAGTQLVPTGTKVEKFATLSLNHNTTGIATGVTVVALPANSVITSMAVKVDTAFDSGTTDVIDVGYGASLNELVAAQDLQSTGVKSNVTNAIPMARTTATTVKAKITKDGTASTAGKVTIVLGYI